jgi:hypothetical protein
MVRHWTQALATERDPAVRHRLHRSRTINGTGAALTGVVLVVVLVTKFVHGAYLAVIAMPAIFLLMKAIERQPLSARSACSGRRAPPEGRSGRWPGASTPTS